MLELNIPKTTNQKDKLLLHTTIFHNNYFHRLHQQEKPKIPMSSVGGFPSSSSSNSLSKWYNAICFTAILVLVGFILTAYEKNLLQLALFGVIYVVMIIVGWGVWAFNTYVFHDDEEPYIGNFIIKGIIITGCLFGASIVISAVTRTYSFLAVLQLGHGFLAPLSTAASSTSSTILTFLMNIPGPIAEEGVFRVALCTIFLGVFAKAGKVSLPAKASIVTMSATAFGFFHWYSYGANLGQIVAAVSAGAILAFYFCFIQKSALIVTAGHFIYNFAVLTMSLLPSLVLSSNSPLAFITISIIPQVSLVAFMFICIKINVHQTSKHKSFNFFGGKSPSSVGRG